MSSAGKWVQMNSTLGWLKEANTVCDCWNTSFYLHDLEVMLFWFAYSTCLHLLNGNFCCNFFSGKAAIPQRHDPWKPSGWMMTCWRQRLLWENCAVIFHHQEGLSWLSLQLHNLCCFATSFCFHAVFVFLIDWIMQVYNTFIQTHAKDYLR